MTFAADEKAKEGSLDWWMWAATEQPPTEAERQERLRLMTLIVHTWNVARKKGTHPVDDTLPANMVCGYLVEAAMELTGFDRRRMMIALEAWSDPAVPLEQRLAMFFSTEWSR